MYTPTKKILERYADVMVNFALGGGKGIKKGDVVLVYSPEVAKPLYIEVLAAIWRAGGHVITRYSPNGERWFPKNKDFFNVASKEQLDFFPEKLMRAQVESIDHSLAIIGETEPRALQGIDPKKIMQVQSAFEPYKNWFFEKVESKKLSWTLCLYGTEAMAKEANISEKEYWNQIIQACFLDKANPIKEWQKFFRQIEVYRKKLSDMPIDKIHVKGPDADLWIGLGEKRAWKAGSGCNIPSFEIFTSPDWRQTNGWIKFNQPLYYNGNLIDGIELEFKDGRVVKSKAKKNEKTLKAMLAVKDADKVGEYSLTDRRFSRITKFMATTLFDENMGGPNGNTHIAVGSAYKDCFKGDPSKLSKKQWQALGYNDSSVHTDIISTAPRTVTATLRNGTSKIIYKNGQFTL